jgi:hypothetical protein
MADSLIDFHFTFRVFYRCLSLFIPGFFSVFPRCHALKAASQHGHDSASDRGDQQRHTFWAVDAQLSSQRVGLEFQASMFDFELSGAALLQPAFDAPHVERQDFEKFKGCQGSIVARLRAG